MPCRRGTTTRNSPVGWLASSIQVSLVSLLELEMIRYRSLRVSPTPTQNFSSFSSNTTTSLAAGVPMRCRQTRFGRQASSTVT